MRVGILGGSFDPVHRGHIEPVEAARRALGLDQVVYLPTAQPPHKPDRRFAPALARFCMVELALLDRPELRVSNHELTLGRPAYTIETIEHLRAERPADELVLLVGFDSFLDLPNWRRFREIVASTRLAVLTRSGFSMPEPSRLEPALAGAVARGTVDFIENAPCEASSSEIRRRLAAGEPIPEAWVPERVLTFLAKYSLYR